MSIYYVYPSSVNHNSWDRGATDRAVSTSQRVVTAGTGPRAWAVSGPRAPLPNPHRVVAPLAKSVRFHPDTQPQAMPHTPDDWTSAVLKEKIPKGWNSLFQAIYTRKLTDVQDCLRTNAGLGKAQALDSYDWTPLHLAACLGCAGSAESLLKYGKVDINARNQEDSTPLHLAVLANNLYMVTFLVNAGAEMHPKNQVGQTPFHLAKQAGNREICEFLLQKTQETVALPRLFRAVKEDDQSTVLEILQCWPKGIHALDAEGNGLLHIAAQQNRATIACYLMKRGLDPHQANTLGDTPHTLAQSAENIDLCGLLDDVVVAALPKVDDEGASEQAKAARALPIGNALQEGQEERTYQLFAGLHIAPFEVQGSSRLA